MSTVVLYFRDSKGSIKSIEIDPSAESKELGDKIKAEIASHEELNATPTEEAFPTLPTISTAVPFRGASAVRSGVAPEQRDGAQILSINDVSKIQKREETRAYVKTWMAKEADASESTTPDANHPEIFVGGETKPIPRTESGRIGSIARAAEGPSSTNHEVENNEETEQPASRTPLTPEATPPTTSDGEIGKLTDIKPFQSAYRMTHESEESPTDTSPETRLPKRVNSTSNANVESYERKAAEWDTKSISATLGSKKTIDSIYDGESIKDLSLADVKGRERGATFTDKVRSLIPRRSSSKLNHKKKDHSPTESPPGDYFTDSSHKRALSTSSLMPPSNDSITGHIYDAPTDTNGYLTAGRRSSEVPEASGSTNHLTRLKRSFSKGEKRKSFTESGSTPHIVGLMRREGGPPVSTALVSPLREHSGFDDSALTLAANDEDEDEEDDEYDGDSDNVVCQPQGSHEDLIIQTVPITADFNGFRNHALDLNPHMASFLADRVAHEQERRFKELKSHKVKHTQDVFRQQCMSGTHCTALGGGPTYLSSRSTGKGEKAQIFLIKDHHDVEEPGVTLTTFQQGVPEPPVSRLPATFECSLCFKERRGINKPSDWTKHVHEDLQPFTCTFKMCTTEKKSFKRKADWVRHENECHRHLDEWRCNYPECQHVCYRSDNFSQHLIREHKVPDFKNKTRGSISSKIRAQPASQYGQEEELIARLHKTCRSASTAQPKSEPCAFCGLVSQSWKKHQVHLSKHMESIALPILGLVAREEVSPDTVVSPFRRDQAQPLMRSNTISDTAPTTDSHPLTPYSTNGSSLHPGSSASESPMGFAPVPRGEPVYSSYPLAQNSFNRGRTIPQTDVGVSVFATQQTSSPLIGDTYAQLGFGPSQTDYMNLNSFQDNEHSFQPDPSGVYGTHVQLESSMPMHSHTPQTYPPPTLRRSPAQNHQQPPTTNFLLPDQISHQEYVSSPHSGTSYHSSTTASPHEMRASLMKHQLDIPRSAGMMGPMPTYTYTEQARPFSSPLEAEAYPNDFHQSIEAQDFLTSTAALNYSGMTATSLPLDYDEQQYGGYPAHTLAPHLQPPYRYQ